MDFQVREIQARDGPHSLAGVKAAVDRTRDDELADIAADVHSIFVAVAHGAVVGSGFIRWLGPRDPRAHALFPDAPEIFRLEVREDLRSRSIGRELVRAMEACAAARGYRSVSLGVGHANPRAWALYRQLGYEDTELLEYYDEYRYPTGDGEYALARDLCRYLVKRL